MVKLLQADDNWVQTFQLKYVRPYISFTVNVVQSVVWH